MVNNDLEDSIDVEIELDFKKIRISRKKTMPGEKAKDEAPEIAPTQKYKQIYFSIVDCAKTSIEERFVPNKDILKDCSWLDPKMFREITNIDTFPPDILCTIPKLCKVDRSLLLIELKQFADQYESLTRCESEKVEYDKKEDMPSQEDSGNDHVDSEEEEENFVHCTENRQCFKCLACAFPIIYELSRSGLFINLYTAYKFVVTLPCTQVTCERVFSKVKIVKNRLRSTLIQDTLSNLILMNVERDLFFNLDKDLIIDKVANTSEELRKKLLV